MRASGSHIRLGRCRREVHGAQECRTGKISLADRRKRSAALHSLQAMHACLRRVDGRRCDRSRQSRIEHSDRNVRRMARLFAVRKLYRSLSDRDVTRRSLSSRDSPVGTRSDDLDRHLQLRRNAIVDRIARRSRAPYRRTRSLRQRSERRVSRRKGPIRA